MKRRIVLFSTIALLVFVSGSIVGCKNNQPAASSASTSTVAPSASAARDFLNKWKA